MKKILSCVSIMLIFLTAMLFASCDEHEVEDLSIHPGHILCNDGTVMPASDFFASAHKIPVAVIFTDQLKEDDHATRYLAVTVKELPCLALCDSVNMVQGTNTDVNALAGDQNTVALQNSYDSRTNHGSPLADCVFAGHIYGQSDFIASAKEMKLLYYQRSLVNSVLRRINEKFPGYADVLYTEATDSCWYWTSTEVAANPGKQAWLFSMPSGSLRETPKVEPHAARAVVSYYPFNE